MIGLNDRAQSCIWIGDMGRNQLGLWIVFLDREKGQIAIQIGRGDSNRFGGRNQSDVKIHIRGNVLIVFVQNLPSLKKMIVDQSYWMGIGDACRVLGDHGPQRWFPVQRRVIHGHNTGVCVARRRREAKHLGGSSSIGRSS